MRRRLRSSARDPLTVRLMSTVELDYELVGPADAPVLMLAGSLGSTSGMWDPQVAALRERFRVLRYDHRGHGRSSVPPGPYSMDELAADALVLLDRITRPTVVIAGADDPATPVAPHAELIASGIPGARLEVLDDAAHLATLQQPQRANSMIAEHLAATA